MPEYTKETEQRIHKMIEALIKVTRGDYSTQIELSSEHDLLDSLAMGINMMIDDTRKTLELKDQNRQIKKQNSALEISLKRAEENERLKSAFLANMSHEIRTPLNSILGFSEILRPDLEEGKFHQYREIIFSSGRHLMQVIDDILDISKLESNQLTIFKEPCNICDILDEQFELHSQNKSLINNPSLELKKPIIPRNHKKLVIDTDPVRLAQVLNNLINNAIKFTDEGSIEFGFTINKKKNQLEFFVKDTGLGIHQDKLDSIFNRFIQAENHRLKEGNGLGLSICRGLLELLEGKIWVESQPGIGSNFYFTLPYKVPQTISKEKLTIAFKAGRS